MEGFDVFFLMGNDENTIKVLQQAQKLGIAPKPYVDGMSDQFQQIWKALSLTAPEEVSSKAASSEANSCTARTGLATEARVCLSISFTSGAPSIQLPQEQSNKPP